MSSCGLVGHVAGTEITNGFRGLWRIARDAIGAMEDMADEISDLVEGIAPTGLELKEAKVGEVGGMREISVRGGGIGPVGVPGVPDAPGVDRVQYRETAKMPEDTVGEPGEVVMPGDPKDLEEWGGIGDVGIEKVEYEGVPERKIPEVPQLRPIEIPRVRGLEFPEVPDVELPRMPAIGVEGFSWEEGGYEPTVREEVVGQIKAVLAGSHGIPDTIWDMIWARARRQATQTGMAARQEIIDTWASRGFSMPPGALRKRYDAAISEESAAISDIIKEQVIQDAKIYVERLSDAMAKGIALEEQLIGLFNAKESRALEAAKARLDASIAAGKFVIERINAEVAIAIQQIEAVDRKIRAELAKLEEDRVRLLASAESRALNQQTLDLFQARVNAVLSEYDRVLKGTEILNQRFKEVETRIQEADLRIRERGLELEEFKTRWGAIETKIRGEVAKLEPFKVGAEIFSQRVRAYETQAKVDQTRLESEIRAEELKLAKYEADLKRIDRILRGIELEIQGEGKDAELEQGKARIEIEQNKALHDAGIREKQIELENLKINLDAAINEARTKIADAEMRVKSQQAALEAIMRTNASVGASALAALNYTASVSESASNSTTCATTYSYSY